MTASNDVQPDKAWPEPTQDNPDGGWWQYGVGGYIDGRTKKQLPPTPSMSRLDAEIMAERVDKLYVVRRWVTPGVWEKAEPDDHPGVADWTWEQYLIWRDREMLAAGVAAKERLGDLA